MIGRLLENPEKYRVGRNYKATNIVFPVEIQGKKFIVKKPRLASSLINAYYVLQDSFLYKSRRLSTVKKRFENEAKNLIAMDGLCAPKLVAYEKETIVREYVVGREFRRMRLNKEIKETLEGALESLVKIHERGITIGDAHVKNILQGNNETYWLDFDGLFYNMPANESRAIDLLKFVYSTYSCTESEELTAYAARLVWRYPNFEVMGKIKDIVSLERSSLSLWLSTRMPLDGKLNDNIRNILTQ